MQQEMVGIIDGFLISYVLYHYLCFMFSVCHVSGDVLVILDLCPDQSLFEAGVAREVILKLSHVAYMLHQCPF